MRTIARGKARDDEQVETQRRLQEDIIFGRLAPGTRLVEDALMARYTASRHYVRQALVALERAGLVHLARNVGATVRAYSPDEVVQIYEAREVLTRQVTLMIPLPAPAALVERLTAIQTEYRRHAEERDLRALHETNDAFHLEMFAACGNPYLVQTVQDYMRLTLPMRAANLADEAGLRRSVREHDAMLALLAGTDPWSLAQLNIEHMQSSKIAYINRVAQAPRPAADAS